MPKMSEPVTVAAPPAGTLGSTMMVPLLSVAKSGTGFSTWLVSGAPMGLQAVAEHE